MVININFHLHIKAGLSIVQHFNVVTIAENDVLAPVDGNDFVVCAASRARCCDFDTVSDGKDCVRFMLVCIRFREKVVKGYAKGEAEDRKGDQQEVNACFFHGDLFYDRVIAAKTVPIHY